MASTRPLRTHAFQVRRYEVQVLSGPHRDRTCAPDDDGKMRVARASAARGERKDHEGGWLWLRDPTVSQLHLELEARPGGVLLRDTSTNGTWLGGAKIMGQHLDVVETVELRVGETDLRLSVETRDRSLPLSTATAFGGIVGIGPAMQRVFARVERLAASKLPLLITGETGTGKTMLAKAIHDLSKQAGKPFSVIDCASLSMSVLESELFGHRKGAFTHALETREGIFEAAGNGTVFIDEIGELSLDAQSRFLRVLEEKCVRRVGENSDRRVSSRVIAATNRDLAGLVSQERFRLDLYERLAVGMVEMPPLRERREDIALIVRGLLERIRAEGEIDVPPGLTLSEEMIRQLERRDWPGNVRELYNYLRYFLAVGEVPPARAIAGSGPSQVPLSIDDLLDRSYDDAHEELLLRFDRLFLTHQLKRSGDRISGAAQRGGMHRVTFSRRLKECGVHRSFRAADGEEGGAT